MASFNVGKTSQTVSHKENHILKQSKSISPKCQRSVSKHTATSNKSANEHKHRSVSFSNGVDQVIDFMQRKFSRVHDEEKREFDDLHNMK
jgi:hypothetical protein